MNNFDADLANMAQARKPSVTSVTEKSGAHNDADFGSGSMSSMSTEDEPTPEELKTLRRVSGPMPWQSMTVAFVEFAERFSYYGSTAVFVNFVRCIPLRLRRSDANHVPRSNNQGHPSVVPEPSLKQQNVSRCTARLIVSNPAVLTRGNKHPPNLMIDTHVPDIYSSKTIQWSILAAIIGHCILIVSSIPAVMDNAQGALGCFAVGLVVMGIGTGGFKSNISPLLAEQIKQTRPIVITTKTGERVIQDPAVTVSRIFLYFYMCINFGSLAGGIGMVYAERFIGFWLAYALPTFVFFAAPFVLMACKKNYVLAPPTGSVLSRAFRLISLACKGSWSINPVQTYKNLTREGFWEDVKPSRLGSSAPAWMKDIDDPWVDQVARGLSASKVFFWMPLYWLAYNQMVNNLTSQSATLSRHGVPNDLINNLNPITLVIFIPIMDFFVYPRLRKAHIRFTPIKRITWGFCVASAAMVSSAVIQYYIYKTSACPDRFVSSGIDDQPLLDCTSPINVWVQTVPYCLIAFSEIFASITTLEYAFSKAPENMRGLVMAINLLQNAFSAAIGQALVPLATDPLLIWNYGLVAVLAFVGGVGFWFTWRKLDAREDELNMIQQTKYKGRGAALQDEEKD
nr:putative peptide transporter ptr2 [Quercus suber]